jgi:predicted HTH transcriptional regulator
LFHQLRCATAFTNASLRKIFVRVFRDRIEVDSPGYAPKPLTLAKLRRGGYRPCSRNSLIAQTLATQP